MDDKTGFHSKKYHPNSKGSNTISPRIAANNALSETVAKNESLGMAEYSPLTLLGKATNYVAGKIAGDSETGRVIRSSVKASDIVKSRKK
jgi:hypothetical protein